MYLTRDGSFTFEIEAEELSRGLRPSEHSPRNKKFLVESTGAIGYDNVLQTIEDLSEFQLDTSIITATFPYPQMFVFANLIIVCGESNIYELVAGSLVHRLGPVAAGNLWSAIDLFDFIYMSNNAVAVIRDPNSKVFSITAELPTANAICNFNGQVHIGSPGVV